MGRNGKKLRKLDNRLFHEMASNVPVTFSISACSTSIVSRRFPISLGTRFIESSPTMFMIYSFQAVTTVLDFLPLSAAPIQTNSNESNHDAKPIGGANGFSIRCGAAIASVSLRSSSCSRWLYGSQVTGMPFPHFRVCGSGNDKGLRNGRGTLASQAISETFPVVVDRNRKM